ncbi:sigma-70 family RNA polymerase sigma factor [Polluticaenibacter yanchengensis]|uniref:RNA polymerase sigma factor RpoD/SigA n=1 Tax=Polluticaenibacter yanchengensis TaxID=3014562 RepID=A0ABT4UM25_9BACT|nr:RNA polymerase sigma factor RpoD/SigA [Chitinophagaceae bacterium LY-5]
MRGLKITSCITSKDSDSIDKYLYEINKYPLLSDSEEVRLSQLIKEGCKKSLNKLVESNLRFVISVAKKFQHQGLLLSDLINEGNLGLIKAAEKFDATKGFKFISYAVWWIRQSIMYAIMNNSRMIRLPASKAILNNKINKAVLNFEQENEREPTMQELAELTSSDAQAVLEICNANLRCISVESGSNNENETKISDILPCSEIYFADHKIEMQDSLKSDLLRTMDSLSDRQRTVLFFYYGIGLAKSLSLEEIGACLSLSRERVRQIKEAALKKLQTSSRLKLLKIYVC